MNRREWLAGAAAAGCSLGVPGSLIAGTRLDRCTVVFDGRYSDAARFADELMRLGAQAVDTSQDPAWIVRPALLEGRRLMGLTPASDLALLRGCAAQPGLRVVHKALHDARPARGRLAHRIEGTQASDVAATLARAGSNWPALLARQLAMLPGHGAIARAELTTASIAADHPGTLSSWMLLPRSPGVA
jgi:hypothetical protein